ncbi:unnamed protein product [Schistosoma turkestanicum]|nr:unnamed protein product [Schistosoma turkestanicum]
MKRHWILSTAYGYCGARRVGDATRFLTSRALMASVRIFKPRMISNYAMRLKHTLPPLPYEPTALEPVISGEIMQLHHSKHHAAYVNNLNIAEEQLAEAISKSDLTRIISIQKCFVTVVLSLFIKVRPTTSSVELLSRTFNIVFYYSFR